MISLLVVGDARPADLRMRPAGHLERLGVLTLLGQRAAAVDVHRRRVTLADGQSLPYDRLLFATGADPRPIKAQGLELKQISFMRTMAQVEAMRAALPRVRRALVLGGGLVGFKAAYSLLRRAIPVTMLIASDYPLALQVDRTTGGLILEALRRHGLEVRVGVEATAFEGREAVERARTSDGATLPCDLVVIGKGVLPARGPVPREAVAVDLGILVDERLETSCPGVYAAGDAAESVDLARGCRWVNALWPEAAEQGRVAGANMAGRAVAYPGSLSRNVIRIFDLDVMTAGLVSPPPGPGFEILERHDARRRTHRRLVFQGARLVGFSLVNAVEQGGVLTALIRSRTPVDGPRERLLAPGFNFGSLPVRGLPAPPPPPRTAPRRAAA
jgi:NAD(P)H-nitrite reductase large subunit